MSERSERLKAARIAKGFATATDAVRAHGWVEATYLGHENGSRGLGRSVEKYARAYGTTVGWLLNGEGSPPGRRAAARGVDEDALQAKALDLLKTLARMSGPKAVRLSRLIVKLSAADPATADKILDEMIEAAKD